MNRNMLYKESHRAFDWWVYDYIDTITIHCVGVTNYVQEIDN